MTETDTGVIPARGEALVRGLGAGHLRDGSEMARACRRRKNSVSFTMPGAGSTARRAKAAETAVVLRSWCRGLLATTKTERCLLKKNQALNSLGHFLRTLTPFEV